MNQFLQHNKSEGNSQAKCIKRIHFEEIDSTNNWAKEHFDVWSSDGITLVTANKQWAGRGRFNRSWQSPAADNLYASFCFWLPKNWHDLGHLPQLLALAVMQVVEKLNFQVKIKWPNDLLIDQKKLGGILCEVLEAAGKKGMICGLGLNVNMSADELKMIDRPATSLAAQSGKKYDLEAILSAISLQFSNHLVDFFSIGFSHFYEEFKNGSAFKKGERIRFHDGVNQLIEAYYEDICPDGALQLRLLDGQLKRFYAGEFISEMNR
jgi:BirA family transcriptional regulator, biotin operon repressor / biotin---[acetyl-CoA-carboxylase] ligase